MPKMENISFSFAQQREERKERVNIASGSSFGVVFVSGAERIKDASAMSRYTADVNESTFKLKPKTECIRLT